MDLGSLDFCNVIWFFCNAIWPTTYVKTQWWRRTTEIKQKRYLCFDSLEKVFCQTLAFPCSLVCWATELAAEGCLQLPPNVWPCNSWVVKSRFQTEELCSSSPLPSPESFSRKLPPPPAWGIKDSPGFWGTAWCCSWQHLICSCVKTTRSQLSRRVKYI